MGRHIDTDRHEDIICDFCGDTMKVRITGKDIGAEYNDDNDTWFHESRLYAYDKCNEEVLSSWKNCGGGYRIIDGGEFGYTFVFCENCYNNKIYPAVRKLIDSIRSTHKVSLK